MIIHTHKPIEVTKILEELELKYHIRKKFTLKYYENNWYDLPSFKWNEDLLRISYFVVKLPVNKRHIFFKSFDNPHTKRNYIYYKKEKCKYYDYDYQITHKINPKYPIYIISKGRYEKRLTINALDEMDCPYKLVVESEEFDKYNKYIKKENILILPKEYQKTNQGGVPARNFVWEHAKKRGYKKHWILDDNIYAFYRWNLNTRKKVKSGVVFNVLENYTDRYENIGLSAMSYKCHIPAIKIAKMLSVNSRCYSCILVNHELLDKNLEKRWRGKYNEDTDLTIRVLQSGLCTFLFNNFLCDKAPSGAMKGGNTTTIYDNGSHSGYQKKFDALKKMHPDIVKFTNRMHIDRRPHHIVKYGEINDKKPILKKEFQNIKKTPNEYNMRFKDTKIIKQLR